MALERSYNFYSYDAYPNGNVKMSSVLKAMQQLAREDLDNMGVTYPMMRKDNLVFVLIKLRVKFKHPVSIYDKITIKTIPTKIVGIYFIRDFFFYNTDGDIVGEASSSWVLLNYETRRPQRPNALNYSFPHSDEIVADCPLSRNILCDGSPVETNVRSVRLSDMDENNHLNNAIIADFVTDELEKEIVLENCNVKDIEIHFHKEAHLSDDLGIEKYVVSEHEKTFEIMAKFNKTDDISFIGRVVLF